MNISHDTIATIDCYLRELLGVDESIWFGINLTMTPDGSKGEILATFAENNWTDLLFSIAFTGDGAFSLEPGGEHLGAFLHEIGLSHDSKHLTEKMAALITQALTDGHL